MPSRCIFFLSALRAWSTLLSRTRTCTLLPLAKDPAGYEGSPPGRSNDRARLQVGGGIPETGGSVHSCRGLVVILPPPAGPRRGRAPPVRRFIPGRPAGRP